MIFHFVMEHCWAKVCFYRRYQQYRAAFRLLTMFQYYDQYYPMPALLLDQVVVMSSGVLSSFIDIVVAKSVSIDSARE